MTGAYLQGEYEKGEVVYARPPKGCRTVHDDGSPIVWLMRVPPMPWLNTMTRNRGFIFKCGEKMTLFEATRVK